MKIFKKIIEILLMLMVPFCYGIGLYLLIPAVIEDPSYVPYYVCIIFFNSFSRIDIILLLLLARFTAPCIQPQAQA